MSDCRVLPVVVFQSSRPLSLHTGELTVPTPCSLASHPTCSSFKCREVNGTMSAALDRTLSQLERCELLPESRVKSLCERLQGVLAKEANIVTVAPPVTIVGDIHGQFFDLHEMFKVVGSCPNTNFLFLGDYVDRGAFSVETICYLVALKLRWPNRVTLLRGNHESEGITQVYGFYAEVMRKYGSATVWKHLVELFNFFPISAVVGGSVYCVHGGLSPSIQTLDQLRLVDRFQELQSEGPLADIMWSDPDPTVETFSQSKRGVGFLFGESNLVQFLRTNSLHHVVRSHQLCMDGFQSLFDDQLTTVWSAPNYCYRCGNVAAVMNITEDMARACTTYLEAPESERRRPDKDTNKDVPDYFL